MATHDGLMKRGRQNLYERGGEMKRLGVLL